MKFNRDEKKAVDLAEIIEGKLAFLREEIQKHRKARFSNGELTYSLDGDLKVYITPLVNRYLRSSTTYASGEDGYTTELFGIPCEVVHEAEIAIYLSIKL